MIALPFIANTLLNFVVGLLVAKFLGPAEYGRYAIVMSIGTVLQTVLFDWLRLSATRFTSEQDRIEKPEIAATIHWLFLTLAGVAIGAALIIAVAGFDLPLEPGLVALAILAAIANGLFDLGGALLRARFLDRGYRRFVMAKTLLSVALIAGGAWAFHSAEVAIAGLAVSVFVSAVLSRRDLVDGRPRAAHTDKALIGRFATYALPIILANALYQGVPLMNRTAASHLHDFAVAGELALAFDMGLRVLGAIGSTLDVLLFQLAVRAEKTESEDAARRQVATNIGLVIAIIAPAVAGCWLVLPSFQALLIAEAFRGPFAHYFTLLLPAFLAFPLTMYCVVPIFQIVHRTWPLVVGGAVALFANAVAIVCLPATPDASNLALAQSISSLAGLATVTIFAVILAPTRPNWRDIGAVVLATAAMVVAVAPLRGMAPGIVALAVQGGLGTLVYGAIALAFDIGGIRRALGTRLEHRRATTAPA